MQRLAIAATLVFLPSVASAHIELIAPPQRYPAANQYEIPVKNAPCGRADNAPGMVGRTTFAPGETITVRWNEFVPHSGHFRIAFDPDGDDDLGDPTGYDDLYTAGVQVLEDGIPHVPGQPDYEVQVTLPDVECSNCTLQLIQVMTDKMPWGPAGGDDLYYQCADLELKMGAGTSGGSTTGGSSGGGGETSTTEPATTSNTGGGSETSTSAGDTSGGATGAGPTSDGSDAGTDGGSSDESGGSGCRVVAADPRWEAFLLSLLLVRRRRAGRRWHGRHAGAMVRR